MNKVDRPRRRRSRFRGCRGKSRFATAEEAAQAASQATFPYPCRFCACWHLASR